MGITGGTRKAADMLDLFAAKTRPPASQRTRPSRSTWLETWSTPHQCVTCPRLPSMTTMPCPSCTCSNTTASLRQSIIATSEIDPVWLDVFELHHQDSAETDNNKINQQGKLAPNKLILC